MPYPKHASWTDTASIARAGQWGVLRLGGDHRPSHRSSVCRVTPSVSATAVFVAPASTAARAAATRSRPTASQAAAAATHRSTAARTASLTALAPFCVNLRTMQEPVESLARRGRRTRWGDGPPRALVRPLACPWHTLP